MGARTLLSARAPEHHAALVAAHLVEANLVGHDSHGVIRVAQYLDAIENEHLLPAAECAVTVDHVSSTVLDGRRGFGQVAGQRAMHLAVEKAARSGVAAVAARNCYHSGRLGSYAAWAAKRGFVALVMVNAGGGGQTVAPFGGLARRLATNPIAIAAPSNGDFPVVLDIATSVAPEGKVRSCHQRGEPVPSGWIVDDEGRPTTNTDDFYSADGALLPLGGSAGHKGFGLALLIDILAGALSRAGCCREEVVDARDGMLVIAIDIARYTSPQAFGEHVRRLIGYVKSSPTVPGVEEVLVPGELEHRCQMIRSRHGIQVDEATWLALEAASRARGVAAPKPSKSILAGPHVAADRSAAEGAAVDPMTAGVVT